MNSETRRDPTAPARTRSALARIGLLGILLLATTIAGYKLGWFDYRHTLEHVSRLRQSHSLPSFAVGFVLVFGIAASVGVPGMPLTVAAGAMFGTVLGTVLSWTGAMLGAAGGYWIARTIGHGVVSRWLHRWRRVGTVVEESRDFEALLWIRLLPVLPLGVVNFIAGLARAPFGAYLAATGLGILPWLAVYSYFADSLVQATTHDGGTTRVSLIVASMLMMVLSFAPWLLKRRHARARKAREQTRLANQPPAYAAHLLRARPSSRVQQRKPT